MIMDGLSIGLWGLICKLCKVPGRDIFPIYLLSDNNYLIGSLNAQVFWRDFNFR
jgi:hypothetical protein